MGCDSKMIKLKVETILNPTEDEQKVKEALSYIFNFENYKIDVDNIS